jgi:hypothetical protein
MWLVHPNHKPKKVTRTAQDAFTLADFDNGLTGAIPRRLAHTELRTRRAITMSISRRRVGDGHPDRELRYLQRASRRRGLQAEQRRHQLGCCRVTAFVSSTQVTVEVMVAFGATAASRRGGSRPGRTTAGGLDGEPFPQRLVMGGNASEARHDLVLGVRRLRPDVARHASSTLRRRTAQRDLSRFSLHSLVSD